MKNVLKFILLAAVICLIVAVAGCTGSEQKATPTPTPTIAPTAEPTATSALSALSEISKLAPGVYPGENGATLTVYADHSYDIVQQDGSKLSYGADGKVKISAGEGSEYTGDENGGTITQADGSIITWKKLDNGKCLIEMPDGTSMEVEESYLKALM